MRSKNTSPESQFVTFCFFVDQRFVGYADVRLPLTIPIVRVTDYEPVGAWTRLIRANHIRTTKCMYSQSALAKHLPYKNTTLGDFYFYRLQVFYDDLGRQDSSLLESSYSSPQNFASTERPDSQSSSDLELSYTPPENFVARQRSASQSSSDLDLAFPAPPTVIKRKNKKKPTINSVADTEAKPGQNTCTICWVNEPIIALFPCRHLGYCYQCSKRLIKCGICNSKIESRERI
jgi:hypothetical protein